MKNGKKLEQTDIIFYELIRLLVMSYIMYTVYFQMSLRKQIMTL